jgi:hypothetical protein
MSRAPAEDAFRDPAGSVPTQPGRPVPNRPMENLAESIPGLAPFLLIAFMPENDPRCAGRRGREAARTTKTIARRLIDAWPDTS